MKYVSFQKLWDKCKELELNKRELFRDLNMSNQTLNAMMHDEVVSMRSIDKLCSYFKCQPEEIMEIV